MTRNQATCASSGFTLIELLIVVAILGVIAAIAIPSVLRARMAANESSAIASVRAIHSAQASYASTCATGGFAQSLEDLALPPVGSTQPFVSTDLSINGSIKSGYIATVSGDVGAVVVAPAANTCNASTQPALSSYFAELHPVQVNATGNRSFAVDGRGVIFVRADGVTIVPGMAGASVLQ